MKEQEQRVRRLLQDLEVKLQDLSGAGWQDVTGLTRQLASYCESCLNVCQEVLIHREFSAL